jgi:hypothetical protein
MTVQIVDFNGMFFLLEAVLLGRQVNCRPTIQTASYFEFDFQCKATPFDMLTQLVSPKEKTSCEPQLCIRNRPPCTINNIKSETNRYDHQFSKIPLANDFSIDIDHLLAFDARRFFPCR